MRPRIEPCDIEDVIGTALRDLKDEAAERSVSIDIAPGLPLVPMDFVLIEQVLVNLLDNALKYSPRDAPIVIRAQLADHDLAVTVSDRGPGIPNHDLEHLFEEFYRGDRSMPAAGIGLGLTICKGFIEAHGGHIQAYRESPTGMSFQFCLPVRAEVTTAGQST